MGAAREHSGQVTAVDIQLHQRLMQQQIALAPRVWRGLLAFHDLRFSNGRKATPIQTDGIFNLSRLTVLTLWY